VALNVPIRRNAFMKLGLVLCLAMAGCASKATHIASPVAPVVEVTRRPLPPSVVIGEASDNPYDDDSDNPYTDDDVIEAKPLVHTWLTLEDIQAAADKRLRDAMEEAVRNGTACRPGDPLCSDLDTPEVKAK
jgi:hypothetical protein